MSTSDRIKQARVAIQAATSPAAVSRAADKHGIYAERDLSQWIARGHGLNTVWGHRTKTEALVAWANGQTTGADEMLLREKRWRTEDVMLRRRDQQ